LRYTSRMSRGEGGGRRPGPQFARCHLCRHPERARIEHLIARGASKKNIGEKFGVSEHSVGRHWKCHVSETVKAACMLKALKPGETIEKLVTDENIGLLENLQRIRAILYSNFDAAHEAGDRHAVSALANRLHENLKIAALKTGELEKTITSASITNVILSPAYLELRGALLLALRRYPEAAEAVVAAFRRVELNSGLLGPAVDHRAA
jgi:hypothetical protein